MYVGQQGDGSTFNCLVNRARTEIGSFCSSSIFEMLGEEQANPKHNSGCQYLTGHVGVSFEDRNTNQWFLCKLLTLVILVRGTDINREISLGRHVPWENTITPGQRVVMNL